MLCVLPACERFRYNPSRPLPERSLPGSLVPSPIPPQERRCMKEYATDKIRNIVVLGHGGVG